MTAKFRNGHCLGSDKAPSTSRAGKHDCGNFCLPGLGTPGRSQLWEKKMNFNRVILKGDLLC